MKVLLVGGGGREHALARKISESPKCDQLYIAPGNAGTAQCGENVKIDETDFEAIEDFVLQKGIYMVVVGPEEPLVRGLHDYFLDNIDLMNIPVIGPAKAAAQLEGSKDFAKQFMKEYDIPTAAYQTFDHNTLSDGYQFLDQLSSPYVLKADGLAGGKGVLICEELSEAKNKLQQMVEEQEFGQASEQVVIEEFLDGQELSVFILTDGDSYKMFPTSKDYKRIGEGDTGPNTGGMGALSPMPTVDEDLLQKIKTRIIEPTLQGIADRGLTYKGFLYFGLMIVDKAPYVLEYNVRQGDPEAQVVLPRLKSDLLDLFEGVWKQRLDQKTLDIDERAAAAVVMASGGYPKAYEKGKVITGLDNVKDSTVFHAGTTQQVDQIVTDGGRVLAVTHLEPHLPEAVKGAYQDVKKINFEEAYYRTDIGKDVLQTA